MLARGIKSAALKPAGSALKGRFASQATLIRPTAIKQASAAFNGRTVTQTRCLATVENPVGGRLEPTMRTRSTPVSDGRATFTIRVGAPISNL